MNSARWVALLLACITVALVAIGIAMPVPSAAVYAGRILKLHSASTAEGAVANLADSILRHDIRSAYQSIGNRAMLSEYELEHEFIGRNLSVRTYATLEGYSITTVQSAEHESLIRLVLRWSTVVGEFESAYDLHVVNDNDRWEPLWPIHREEVVPPQVIPVNYLRWDVIYRGEGDDWGAQNVAAPHVRIVDMHPVERGEDVVILGELLNEDVVPAHVSVKASLVAKDGEVIAAEGTFDVIMNLLLPKQVTPFLIHFPQVRLSDVSTIRIQPVSALVAASADPVVAIENQQINRTSRPTLTGMLTNQSGQVVNVAHVLGTFYNKSGQVVWVADQYVDRALLPNIPAPFEIQIPKDIADSVSSQRAVVATFMYGVGQ